VDSWKEILKQQEQMNNPYFIHVYSHHSQHVNYLNNNVLYHLFSIPVFLFITQNV